MHSFRLWDLLFVVVTGAVVAFVSYDRGAGPRHPLAACVLLALCLLWYASFGRRGLVEPVGAVRRWTFFGVLVALHLSAVWLDQTSSFALFAWAPMVFLGLPIRPAVAVVAALDLLPVGIAALRDGTVTRAHGLLPLALLGLAFATLIGVQIDRLTRQNHERAAMIAELSASRAAVARLSHEAGVAAERTRLAAEIHDTLAQGFTSIITLAQAAESELATDRPAAARRLDLVTRTARDNLAEARALLAALGPADLRSAGLADAVRRQVDRLAAETGLRTSLLLPSTAATIPTAVQVVLVRTLQEALTNVRKHATATSVEVNLVVTADEVTLSVVDDGVGFAPDADADGFGLPAMRARAQQLNAVLTVDSTPGEGTTVLLEVPR